MDAPLEFQAAPGVADRTLTDLIARHGGAVRRVAWLYVRDAGALDDLLQDVWIAVWRSFGRFRGDCAERTFVLRIAHNRGVTHSLRSRAAAGTASVDELDSLPDAAPLPDEVVAGEQVRARLYAALRCLPLGQREVVALRLEGLSDQEIASVVGTTAGNVAVRLTRARQQLRELLQEDA
jgi:RNA polymerase sigma-70 factor (ECF subfamily)